MKLYLIIKPSVFLPFLFFQSFIWSAINKNSKYILVCSIKLLEKRWYIIIVNVIKFDQTFLAVTCAPPKEFPPHVVPFEFKEDKFAIGDKIVYSCNPGFREFGDMSAHCLANSSWSQPTGGCKSKFSQYNFKR